MINCALPLLPWDLLVEDPLAPEKYDGRPGGASMELNRITSREDDCCPIFPERFLPETTEPELTLTAETTIDLWTGVETETGVAVSPQLLTSPTSEIVFIDGAVHDLAHLVAAISPGAEVVVLDRNRDGVKQITQVLAGRTGIKGRYLPRTESFRTRYAENTEKSISSLSANREVCSWAKAEFPNIANLC